MGTAAWAAPVSPAYQSPCLGAGLLWRSLGRSLLANLMRVRLGRLAAGRARQPAVASSLQLFLQQEKNSI